VSGITWSAVLTGAPDSLPDLELIALNFQATLRSSTASFIQVVLPLSQLDDVIARSNGDIVINKTLLPDGAPVELYTVNFNDVRTDEGARSSKLTISGRSEAAFPGPAAVTLAGVVSDGLQSSGARTLAVSPFNDVLPGDTVTYDAVATLIEIVEITGNNDGTSMRLAEA
jgi:hypothetical protein